MDHQAALEVIAPYCEDILSDQLQAYRLFDQSHSDEAVRLSVEGARPKWVHERVAHLLEMRYGTKGAVRLVRDGQLAYLMIEGPEFNLGLRPKKCDEHWRSSNHHSDAQDELRRSGRFLGWDVPTYHGVLGYRETEGLQPSISHVAITWERSRGVEIIRLLWTATQGVIPMQDQLIQRSIDLPKGPKISRKKKRPDSDGENRKKKRG